MKTVVNMVSAPLTAEEFLKNRDCQIFVDCLFHNRHHLQHLSLECEGQPHCDIAHVMMTMAGMEKERGSFSASMNDECSGKYLLPHKYSFTVPKGSVWEIWGSQKKPGVIGGP